MKLYSDNIFDRLDKLNIWNINNYEDKNDLKEKLIFCGLIDNNCNVKSHDLIELLFCENTLFDSKLINNIKIQFLDNTNPFDSDILRNSDSIDLNLLYKKLGITGKGSRECQRTIKYFLLDFNYIIRSNDNYHYVTNKFKSIIKSEIEQLNEIEQLKKRIKQLEKENEQLKKRIKQLEKENEPNKQFKKIRH